MNQFLRFVFQAPCLLCSRFAFDRFCPDCQRRVECDRLLDPAQYWHDSPRVFAWGSYRDTLKRAISGLKYDRQPDLATPLGEWLAKAWLQHPISHNRVLSAIPIPLHPDKQQQRGYNQAELIARAFCRITGYPLAAQGLTRIRPTEALFNLSPQQREQTLTQAFQLGRVPRKTQILLIDDIYTTGATVRAAIQVLNRSGYSVLGVAAVAKAKRQ